MSARAEHARRRQNPTRRTATSSDLGRSRLILLGAVVVSAVIIFAWFPFGSLLHQRSTLSGTEVQLSGLRKQDLALAQEKKNLSNADEIGRIAREQYQLVNPGQQAYEVLPPAGSSSAGTPYAGDPGSTGPVAPTAAPELPPGGVTTTTTTVPPPSTHAGRAGSQSDSGMLARMLYTLEFWR